MLAFILVIRLHTSTKLPLASPSNRVVWAKGSLHSTGQRVTVQSVQYSFEKPCASAPSADVTISLRDRTLCHQDKTAVRKLQQSAGAAATRY